MSTSTKVRSIHSPRVRNGLCRHIRSKGMLVNIGETPENDSSQRQLLAVDRHTTAIHVDCLEATIPRAAQEQTVAGVLATQHGRKPVLVPRHQQIGVSVAIEVLRQDGTDQIGRAHV